MSLFSNPNSPKSPLSLLVKLGIYSLFCSRYIFVVFGSIISWYIFRTNGIFVHRKLYPIGLCHLSWPTFLCELPSLSTYCTFIGRPPSPIGRCHLSFPHVSSWTVKPPYKLYLRWPHTFASQRMPRTLSPRGWRLCLCTKSCADCSATSDRHTHVPILQPIA